MLSMQLRNRMIDIIKNSEEKIFRDKKKGGLLVSFAIAYQKETGKRLNVNCGKCMATAYNQMTKKYSETMAKEPVQCDYELHFKYNGIQLGVNGDPIRNGEMTNAIAKKLLKEHPHGAKLFSKIPTEKPKKSAKKATSKETKESNKK